MEDQLGRTIELSEYPKRIISLVPSQTELLHYFGLENEVAGITKFCIHPEEWFKKKTRVGGTKNVDHEKVNDIQPDLIIANKEENTPEDINKLAESYPVYVSDINTIADALKMIRDVGMMTNNQQKAVDLLDDIQDDFNAFPKYDGNVLYFIWKEPYMVCGTENFIHSMIEKLGFKNLISDPRYVEISMDEIKRLNPDYIFLSTEPFPFSEKHKIEIEEITNARVMIVDGEMFSWYGSRMLKMKQYFDQLI